MIFVTALSFLLCSRIRQDEGHGDTQELTVEQVRRRLKTWLQHHDLPPHSATKSSTRTQPPTLPPIPQRPSSTLHTQTRIELYEQLGVHVDQIKSCIPINQS